MSYASLAFANLTASLESASEPREPKASKRTYGLEALDSAELSSQLNLLQQSMAMESRRLDTASKLQSALESQTHVLSPLQAQMYHDVAQRIGLKMAHERYGFGLESYSGLRGRTLLRASTEGFKEWFKTFLERLVKLWKQLVAWVKNTFNARYRTLRSNRNAIKGTRLSKVSVERLVTRALPAHFANIAKQLFSTREGRYEPKTVLANTAKVFHSVTDGAYFAKVRDFNKSLVEHARPLVEADGNAWRKEAARVNGLQFPMPEGFEVIEQEKTKATWVSPPMAGGVQIRVMGTVSGNVHGARGMEDTATALAEVSVGELMTGQVQMRAVGDVSDEVVAKASVDVFEDALKLIDEALQTESKIKPLIQGCEEMTREIEALSQKVKQSEGDTANYKIAANLLKAAERSDVLLSAMVDKSVEAIVHVSNFTKSLYFLVERAQEGAAEPQAQAA